MKKLVVFLFVSTTLLVACNKKAKIEDTTGTVQDINKAPIIKFETEKHDFGKITEGDVVEYRYKFENKGNSPLAISDVQAQCGCTVPTWPRQPIAPGDEDIIIVKFDSKGKVGPQTKWITVYSNSFNGQDRVSFTAEVATRDTTAQK